MGSPEFFGTGHVTSGENLGLLAIGASGPWEFSVDETITGTERWYAQIEGPSVYITFEIPSPEIVAEALRYLVPNHDEVTGLTASARPLGGLCLSKCPGTPVCLLRDDEYEDRCFLIVGLAHSPLVRYTLEGEALADLVKALTQANQEIALT